MIRGTIYLPIRAEERRILETSVVPYQQRYKFVNAEGTPIEVFYEKETCRVETVLTYEDVSMTYEFFYKNFVQGRFSADTVELDVNAIPEDSFNGLQVLFTAQNKPEFDSLCTQLRDVLNEAFNCGIITF